MCLCTTVEQCMHKELAYVLPVPDTTQNIFTV